MGNCCCTKENLTDNNAENLIRESILLLNTQKYDFEELDEKIKVVIGINLLDVIPSDTLKWITRDNYVKILNNIFLNEKFDDYFDFSTFQKLACVSYEDISDKAQNKCNNFLLWILANLRYINSSQSRLDKIKLIENVILATDKMLTYQTFKKFLTNYLLVNLYYVTQNFRQCADGTLDNDRDLSKDFVYIIDDVFNLENVTNYTKGLIEKMKDRVLRSSVSFSKTNFNEEPAFTDGPRSSLNTFSNCISNEFLKRSHLQKFFNENFYLLNVIELRDNFYNIYNNSKTPRYLATA
jgi:hypothetical protein